LRNFLILTQLNNETWTCKPSPDKPVAAQRWSRSRGCSEA